MRAVPRAGEIIAKRYRLDALIGSGGMGDVWAATQTITRRGVALKFLRPELVAHEHVRRRFLQEARAATAVDHPAVVHILDVFELDEPPELCGAPVIVMERLHGESLREALQRHELIEPEVALAIVLPVASALATAHEAGIVHRDLKPDNIFLARAKTAAFSPMMLDFGIAKLLEEDDEGLKTRTGVTMGTPCYMAPEQAAADRDLDHRVDIWALGVVLYECLAGVRPVEANSQGELVKRLLLDAITPLEVLAPDAPDALCALVARMLSVEPEDRPQSMHEVVETLEAVVAELPPVAAWEFPEEEQLAASTAVEPATTERDVEETLLGAPLTEEGEGPPVHVTPLDTTVVDPPLRVSKTAIALVAGTIAVVAISMVMTAGPSPATAPPDLESSAVAEAPPAPAPRPVPSEEPAPSVAVPSASASQAAVAPPPAMRRKTPEPAAKPAWCSRPEAFEVIDDKGTLSLRAECR